MRINDVFIENTFVEAFRMMFCRLVITAIDESWAKIAAKEVTGYGTSIISCDVEAGIEGTLEPDETPDGRPGVGVLFFGFTTKRLAKAVQNRIGQCVLTCPTTAVFDGFDALENAELDAPPKVFDLGRKHRDPFLAVGQI